MSYQISATPEYSSSAPMVQATAELLGAALNPGSAPP